MRRLLIVLSLLLSAAGISQRLQASPCDSKLKKVSLGGQERYFVLEPIEGNGYEIVGGKKTFLVKGQLDSTLQQELDELNSDCLDALDDFKRILGASSPSTKNRSTNASIPAQYRSTITSTALGDLNGDGLSDGVVASGFNYYVQFGKPDGSLGTFANRLIKTFPASALISDLQAIDVNSDRRADLIAINNNVSTSARSAVVMLGAGDGNFAAPTTITAAVCSLWAGDWNGDGRPDVLTCPTNTQAAVFLGQANGTYQSAAPATLPAIDPNVGGPIKILATDLNSDGQLDAVVLYPNRVAVMLGRRDGTLAAPTLTALPFAFQGYGQIHAGDVTGDGKNDLVIGALTQGLFTTLVGDGTGRLVPQRPVQVNGRAEAFFAYQTNLGATLLVPDAPGAGSRIVPVRSDGALGGNPLLLPGNAIAGFYLGDIAVGDFLGTGRSQVVLLSAGGQTPDTRIEMFSGTTSIYGITALPPVPLLLSGQPVDVIGAVTGRFDSDTQLDVAVLVTTGTARSLVILRNAGGGRFTVGSPITVPQDWTTYSLAAADFNGDGITDVALSGYSRQSSTDGMVLVNFVTPQGSFGNQTTLKPGDRQQGLVTADFNGDGRVDLAMVSNSGAFPNFVATAVVYVSQPNGTFSAPLSTPLPAGQADGLNAGSVTGQSRPDLIVGGSFSGLGNYLVLRSKGDGSFTPLLTNPGGRNPDAILRGLYDFNSDGKLDLIGTVDGGLAYYLGRGDGTFGVDNPINAGDSPTAVYFADVAGSTGLEIVVRTGAGATIVPLLAQGLATTVSAASNAPIPLATLSIASVYGSKLATGTAQATTLNQTNLLGTEVLLHQYTNWFPCPLFFVSPGQVNFLIPSALPDGPAVQEGPASIQVTSGDGTTSVGEVLISRISPGVFVANANGLLAGAATRVRGTVQTPLNIVTVSGGAVVPVPIDLGPAGDRVILTLYATGIRARTSLANVVITIGGVPAPASFAGPQGAFAGLDQVNVEIPRSLAGRGEVTVQITVDGQAANAGRVVIQ